MATRTAWLDVIEKLNEALGTYDLRIKRDLVNVAIANSPQGTQQAYAYRVELTHKNVTASQSGLDQPEVVLPALSLRVLTQVGTERTGPVQRSEGYEAFQALLESARLQRGMDEQPNVVREEVE